MKMIMWRPCKVGASAREPMTSPDMDASISKLSLSRRIRPFLSISGQFCQSSFTVMHHSEHLLKRACVLMLLLLLIEGLIEGLA